MDLVLYSRRIYQRHPPERIVVVTIPHHTNGCGVIFVIIVVVALFALMML